MGKTETTTSTQTIRDTKQQYPTKAAAWRAAELLKPTFQKQREVSIAPMLKNLMSDYRMTQEPYVSSEVVADYLSLGRRQVLALTRRGKLPAHPVDTTARRKLWRFKLSEIDAAIAANGTTRGLSRVPEESNNAPGSPRSRRG